MKRAAAMLLLALAAASAAAADPPEALPRADALLRACVGTFPDIPLRVTGELTSRSPAGDLEKKVNVDMLLDWQARPPTARYSTRDAFGKALEHLAVTWNPDQPPAYRFFRGDPLEAAPLPPLTDFIEGTDVTWMDLTLAYLWWPGGRILRAHVFDGAGQLTRRVDVKGFKKINDRWFVQVIEVESRPSRHTTTLRVRDVEDRERKQFIKVDEGGPDPAAGEVDQVQPVTP